MTHQFLMISSGAPWKSSLVGFTMPMGEGHGPTNSTAWINGVVAQSLWTIPLKKRVCSLICLL